MNYQFSDFPAGSKPVRAGFPRPLSTYNLHILYSNLLIIIEKTSHSRQKPISSMHYFSLRHFNVKRDMIYRIGTTKVSISEESYSLQDFKFE